MTLRADSAVDGSKESHIINDIYNLYHSMKFLNAARDLTVNASWQLIHDIDAHTVMTGFSQSYLLVYVYF